jgi:aldose 1-epimerase
MQTSRENFGTARNGQNTELFVLESATGMRVELISYGAAVKSLRVPDKNGSVKEITYGFDTLAEYEEHRFYFGASIGRFANRIARGSFVLDGKTYTLGCNNNGVHHLHGGELGFDRRVWSGVLHASETEASVVFTYVSPDGEEGYPGNVTASVTYTLRDSDELAVTYGGTTDAPTPFNPTNHTFWNIAGIGSGGIEQHVVELNCPFYIPVDDGLIPTGEILSVKNTPMDFTVPKTIGRDIDAVKPAGYDHCFVVGTGQSALRRAARITNPAGLLTMEVLTTAPGMQVYSGNNIKTAKIAGGNSAAWREAVCFETGFFPDSVNTLHFPSPILLPGSRFFSQTVFRFVK